MNAYVQALDKHGKTIEEYNADPTTNAETSVVAAIGILTMPDITNLAAVMTKNEEAVPLVFGYVRVPGVGVLFSVMDTIEYTFYSNLN